MATKTMNFKIEEYDGKYLTLNIKRDIFNRQYIFLREAIK